MDPPRRPVLIPVATPRRSSRLPTGRRLELDKVLLPLIEDGLIVVADAARAKAAQREARSAAEVHPLVLIANLKLPNPQRPGAELTLERLTEWLAAEVALPYLRIDPTRVDVAAVTALISHQYAQRHRILPVAIEAQRYVFAAETAATRYRARRVQSDGPASLQHGVLRRDALGAQRQGRARRCHFAAELRATGGTGPHRRSR
ncbi:MAG: hypothetical protein LKM39_16605 [Chiayiivirga sp.]|jgi:hypothetical protein|nr:hypothetical protein [Chiayiivirga sp.]